MHNEVENHTVYECVLIALSFNFPKHLDFEKLFSQIKSKRLLTKIQTFNVYLGNFETLKL